MTENEKPSVPSRRGYTKDSAADLFAAMPILTMIAKWTGKIGQVYINNVVTAGKPKEARRNAAIIVGTVLVGIFVLIIGVVIWLALL